MNNNCNCLHVRDKLFRPYIHIYISCTTALRLLRDKNSEPKESELRGGLGWIGLNREGLNWRGLNYPGVCVGRV